MPFFYGEWPSEEIDWGSLLLELFGLVGLFGYVFLRRVGAPFFWKVIFIANLIAYAIFVPGMVFDDDLLILGMPYFGYFIIAFTLIFSIPLWLALYRYGFRSQEIWTKPSIST
jgi:hypothetical protein